MKGVILPPDSDYSTYIASPEWKFISDAIKMRDGNKCIICGRSENLNVHHLSYKHFKQERPRELITLCRNCHKNLHNQLKEYRVGDVKNLYFLSVRKNTDSWIATQELVIFLNKYLKNDISQGGNLNMAKADVLNELFDKFGHGYLGVENANRVVSYTRWIEIDRLVASGYAENVGWSGIAKLIGIPITGVNTYKSNMYGKSKTNYVIEKIEIIGGQEQMKHIDLTTVKESGESTRIKAGGYICQYTSVQDIEEKEYLYMEFDIVEGDFRNYYKSLEERAGFWGGKCYRSYKEKALPMFKRMCSAVSKSNPGFIFDGGAQNSDESTLVGKKVGIVLGEEEYIGNDGSVKTRTYVAYECEADKIRRGNYKVPDKKCIPVAQRPAEKVDDSFMNVNSESLEEIPF